MLKPRYPAFTLALLMLGFVNIIKSIFKYCSVSVNDHVPFDCFRFVPLKSHVCREAWWIPSPLAVNCK